MSFAEFGDEKVIGAIKALSDLESDLTLVVGAGSSIESGFPTWGDLVGRLLDDAGQRKGLSEEDCAQFVDWTLQREDLTGAGEVAREMLGESFRDALHDALYSEVEKPIPGETARAIAALRVERLDGLTEVLTTNYDTLLWAAMRDELRTRDLGDHKARRLAGPSQVDPNTISVRHLHGILTEGKRIEGQLVLSDRDYHLMQDSEAWQELFFRNQLETTTCLFVGASLTDPNLLRYIYRSGGLGLHYVVFVRQTDSLIYDSVPEPVARLREQSQADKWRAVKVEPILFDHYAQSAQFLWEVLTAARVDNYEPLPNRLADWRRDLKSILPDSGKAFIETQSSLQRVMRKALDGTKKLLNETGEKLRPGERLGISLWVFDPTNNTLVNWASADRVWRDPATLEPIPVHWSSEFIAAQAFCSGSLVSQSTSQHVVSRWNHVIGFPIYLHRENQRLPVGAVTLASTKDMTNSLLSRCEATVRASAIPALEAQASELLDPWDLEGSLDE